jgi:hypothetical protein
VSARNTLADPSLPRNSQKKKGSQRTRNIVGLRWLQVRKTSGIAGASPYVTSLRLDDRFWIRYLLVRSPRPVLDVRAYISPFFGADVVLLNFRIFHFAQIWQ